MSKKKQTNKKSKEGRREGGWETEGWQITNFVTTAPEFVEGGQFRLSCVFWGLGCLIYQLISGQVI